MKIIKVHQDVFIVIAAYNEESSVTAVIDDLHAAGYSHLVVVDDGSSDRTAENAHKKGSEVHVLRHVINRGQGAALQTGIDYALSQGAEIIVTFDADGQHQASDIPKMMQPLMDGNADICLGSRFLDTTSNVPWIRRALLKAGVVLMYLMYGIKLTDSHNGFRAMTKESARKIRITADRMEHASEILEEVMKHHLRYVEVPVTIKYTPYSLQHGQSSWNALRIAYTMIKTKFL